VVVRHDPGQVGVRCAQFERDRVVAVVDEVFHAFEQRCRSRTIVRVPVVVDRRNDIRCRNFAAGMERGVIVDLETPFLGVGRCRPFGCDIRAERLIRIDHRQIGAIGMRQRDIREGYVFRGVVLVGSVPVVLTDPERAAALRCGFRRFRPKAGCRRSRHAGHQRIVHEGSTGNLSFPSRVSEPIYKHLILDFHGNSLCVSQALPSNGFVDLCAQIDKERVQPALR